MLRRLALLTAAAALIAGCGSSVARQVAPRQSPRRSYTYTSKDRPASQLVTNATPQPGWKPYTGPVPILVYHDLGNAPASEPYPGLYMPYATFEQEMSWLHAQGYQAVTLDEVMGAWYRGGTLPAKPIVITFDNGYLPQVLFAPRVMARYGWPGVLNEITLNHLDPQHLRDVLKLGWEVDSHTEIHSNLTTDSPAELHAELVGSRQFLQRTFHIPVNGFAYPSSIYNTAVVDAVKAAGYEFATTEGHAYATRSEPFLLPRFEQETGLAQLQADLATPH